DQHLAGLRPVGHVLRAPPLGRHQEERLPARATEHAGETAAVEVDRLQHLATRADPHAALVGDVPVPGGSFPVEADAIGDTVAQVGPYPAVRQAAVGGDIEGCESL